MVNITRSFLASSYRISCQCTNQNEIYEAMKQTYRTSVEYKRSIHVKNLYQKLKMDGIGTTQIETITERLCYSLPRHRQRTLVKVITGLYKGETGGNTYTRGQEHRARLAARNINNSPPWRHCVEQHGGVEQTFLMSVTGTFRNDAMLRQITEAVQINNLGVGERMNDRAEWNMTPVPRTVITTR